jgi:hypothetical protein
MSPRCPARAYQDAHRDIVIILLSIIHLFVIQFVEVVIRVLSSACSGRRRRGDISRLFVRCGRGWVQVVSW